MAVEGLKLRPVRRARVASGVAIVPVMARPYPCPHGRCIYCPGGGQTPQSYVDRSPTVMRAAKVNYDPFKQVWVRLQQHLMAGFFPSKVEMILMGGTFTAMPFPYQEWFVRRAFDALNSFPGDEIRSGSLLEAHALNESAKARCVALTIETRPDWAKEEHVDRMLYLGATRVEIGVQSPFDDVLERVRRGHTVHDVIESTRILKDAGYKVCYHLMPGLPGSDLDRDIEAFRLIFEDPDFRPDMLKIYPTLVLPGTPLYEMWRRGEYRGLTEEEALEYLIKVYRLLPRWVRIQHVQRDIPEEYIAAGPRRRNLRQMVERYFLERGERINEIRYREVGHALARGVEPNYDSIRLERIDYEASSGYEVFLSLVDDNDVLMGVLRLRKPSVLAHRWEVDERTAIVREIHVYGPLVPVGEPPGDRAQHRGFGRWLMSEAERIAVEELDARRMLVISGVGARNYFRKLGYELIGGSFYVAKELS